MSIFWNSGPQPVQILFGNIHESFDSEISYQSSTDSTDCLLSCFYQLSELQMNLYKYKENKDEQQQVTSSNTIPYDRMMKDYFNEETNAISLLPLRKNRKVRSNHQHVFQSRIHRFAGLSAEWSIFNIISQYYL